MKSLPAILVALFMCANALAAESEIAIFDEGQQAFSRFETNEIEAWKRIDPQTAAFHEEWKRLNDLTRKRNRLVFLHKLKNKPDAIHWDGWKGWLRPIDSSADAETYLETLPELREITDSFEKQKKELTKRTDLLARRNSFYDKNKEVFKKLENNLTEELSALAKRMDTLRGTPVKPEAVSASSAR